MPRGKPAPIPSGKNQRSRIDGALGDANLQKRAMGSGTMESGTPAGRRDSEFRKFGTRTGKQVYEVRHELGRIPVGFLVWKVENPQTNGTCIAVSAYQPEKWTESTISVFVQLLAGSYDGCEVTIEIGGER